MRRRLLKNVEWTILICSLILSAIGLIALFSASYESGLVEFRKQAIWLIISAPISIIMIFIDYKTIAKIAPVFYGIFIVLLFGVLFTKPINGARSWYDLKIFTFQPAELAKIFVILTIAYVITRIQKKGREEINRPTKLGIILLLALLPILLIIRQPDFGTATAFLLAIIIMIFASGINKKYIIVTLLLVAIAIPVLYLFVLPDHAKARIDVFLNPEKDPRGSGYNVLQSKLAIGSGKLMGMGILKGNQTQLGFLYPKTTDFIFSVIGEEMGFIVGVVVILANVLLLVKSVYIAKTAKDDLGTYIAIGITGIFLFHIVENIGMTMGLLPITGVPLPFVSYGGSSLLTNFLLIGLLLNISARRKKAIFIE